MGEGADELDFEVGFGGHGDGGEEILLGGWVEDGGDGARVTGVEDAVGIGEKADGGVALDWW